MGWSTNDISIGSSSFRPDPSQILSTYPYETRSIEVPNALGAAAEGAQGLMKSIVELPPKLIGGPSDLRETASDVAHNVVSCCIPNLHI